MSVSRPARCLFSASSISSRRSGRQCSRTFHTSPNLSARRRPRFASIKAADMGLIAKPSNSSEPISGLRKYEAADKDALAKRYTPEQLKVIEAGEQSIDLEDVLIQGRPRLDPYRLKYFDDLSHIQPVIDKKPKEKGTIPPNARLLNQKQEADEIAGWIAREWAESEKTAPMSMPEKHDGSSKKQHAASKPTRMDFIRYMEESTSMSGGGKRGTSVIAPALGKIPSVEAMFKKSDEEESVLAIDPAGTYLPLIKQSDLTMVDIQKMTVKILVQHRVVNQTRLGKIQSIYVLAIAGDRNGMLGIGEGKSQENEDAFDKARRAAVRNMQPIPRYENRTIFGTVEGKVSATEVQIMARPPGFGLRCQHNIFEMARAAGIHDLAARVPRSRNKMNTIKAAYQALLSQRLPDEVARGRGKKLVDVRKVYYGGHLNLTLRARDTENNAAQA